ncbi:MAG: 16S rRNA (uracil(1498)-N(3))-methyltransferase [Bacteroidales bacterium]|nr:16S rRNA (uracil(1498)-N(3))-methyltransferase [Bacteroidales bacterium]
MKIFFSDDICDARVRLDAEESGHCVRVLRHRPGDEISVIDGRGTLYRCALEIADAKGAEARVIEAQPGFGAHPYHLTMAVCPTKNIDRFEWFVEKATEIGVDVIAPVIGERSERRVLKTDRLRRLTLSAAKQSLKAAIPAVAEPQSVRDFILAAPEDALKMICYCFDDVERCPITEILRRPAGGIIILIGPEGDFSPEEAALARERGWIPVSLGESRLRTETAAVVAVTAVYLNSRQAAPNLTQMPG